MLIKLVLLLVFLGTTLAQKDQAEEKWLNQSKSLSDELARSSKYDWTGVLDNPECSGNVLNLGPGEATRIKSHKSYGESEYPENYMVRTKFLQSFRVQHPPGCVFMTIDVAVVPFQERHLVPSLCIKMSHTFAV